MPTRRRTAARPASPPSDISPAPATAGDDSAAVPSRQRGPRAASATNAAAKEDVPTLGRLPNGTLFVIPPTDDVVHTLSHPRSAFDWLVWGVVAAELALLYLSGGNMWLALGFYAFWRIAYNLGIGLLLRWQSRHKGFLRLCKAHGFDRPHDEMSPLWRFFARQVAAKMGPDYRFHDLPLEFNSWMLFRGLVDMILVNDFACYFMFAWTQLYIPDVLRWTDWLRYATGTLLILFNVWVKLEAHHVIPYAWYWVDFWLLIEAELTFDGIFMAVPHPMYTVGYSGYYGIALACGGAGGYHVFFVSLAAQLCQFAFLYFFEIPHIEKTYRTPTPPPNPDDVKRRSLYFRRDLIGFHNLDLFRSTDLLSVVIAVSTLVVACIVGRPSDAEPWKWRFYLVQAIVWRCIYTFGMGTILFLQSRNRFWTRHFLKYGDTVQDAMQSWKSIYNLCMVMCYLTFFVAAIQLYTWPAAWSGPVLLRHTFGCILIGLHLYTATSVFEVLGPQGYFYADFFLEPTKGLIYSGIYRFLNNPEKTLGNASFFAMALICASWPLLGLAVFGLAGTWLFLECVEAPHMRKLYGHQIRREAGVQRVIREGAGNLLRRVAGDPLFSSNADHSPHADAAATAKRSCAATRPAVAATSESESQGGSRQFRMAADHAALSEHDSGSPGTPLPSRTAPRRTRLLSDAVTLGKAAVEGWVGLTRDKVLGLSISLVDEVQSSGASSPAVPSLAKLPLLSGLASPPPDLLTREQTYRLRVAGGPTFTVGTPLTVCFRTPRDTLHPRDWIGVYRVGANASAWHSNIPSRGRFLYVTGLGGGWGWRVGAVDGPDEEREAWHETAPDQSAAAAAMLGATRLRSSLTTDRDPCGAGVAVLEGEVVLRHMHLPWSSGVYELRYHANDRHVVMATSPPFEIVAVAPDSCELEDVKAAVTDIVTRCVEPTEPIGPTDLIVSRIQPVEGCDTQTLFERYQKDVYRLIVACIKESFRVDFDYRILDVCPDVVSLSQRIVEARKILLLPDADA